ncbi:hypothetical protein [Liberiplasma polymorphum]|uniref:hypothetical protein n=1 Tax=Liberiplasma polymorphum TaxID=3374570 RepID=UPI003774A85C
MGIPIIYHSSAIKSLESSEDNSSNNILREFFVIPVYPIKVVLSYSNTPEINHFQRGVLSLLLKDYFTKDEIADMLHLNIELVNLILNELLDNGYLDSESKVTVTGREVLTGTYSTIESTVRYVFYDLVRDQIFEQNVSLNDLNFCYSHDNKSIKVSTDAFDKNIVFYTQKSINQLLPNSNQIERLLRKKWSNSKFNDKRLTYINIIGFEKKHYLLSMIETEVGNIYASNWKVKDPFADQIDQELQVYFEKKYYEDIDFSDFIKNLMKRRVDRSKIKSGNEIEKRIQMKLFNKPIRTEDSVIIGPLAQIIVVFRDYSNIKLNKFIYINKQEILRKAHLHLADLFEYVLYLAAQHSGFNFKNSLLSNKDNNQILISNIAKQIGFNVTSDCYKILSHGKKAITKIISHPNKAVIGSCIVLNLLIADNDYNYFFHDFAKRNPNFLQQMYEYKRKYRDTTRHSLSEINIKPSDYIDTLFDLIESALGYKLNRQELDELSQGHSYLFDYSSSEEEIKKVLGYHLFYSFDKTHIKFKQTLITAYDNYLYKNNAYITELRSIFEDLLSNLLNELVSKIHLKSIVVDETINSGLDFKEMLDSLNYMTSLKEEIPIKFEEALTVPKNLNQIINNGLRDKFAKTNLRFKVQCLNILLFNYKELQKIFGVKELAIPNLFTTYISIMYLDKEHKQQFEFNQDYADVIIKESFETIKGLIDLNLINLWRDTK